MLGALEKAVTHIPQACMRTGAPKETLLPAQGRGLQKYLIGNNYCLLAHYVGEILKERKDQIMNPDKSQGNWCNQRQDKVGRNCSRFPGTADAPVKSPTLPFVLLSSVFTVFLVLGCALQGLPSTEWLTQGISSMHSVSAGLWK